MNTAKALRHTRTAFPLVQCFLSGLLVLLSLSAARAQAQTQTVEPKSLESRLLEDASLLLGEEQQASEATARLKNRYKREDVVKAVRSWLKLGQAELVRASGMELARVLDLKEVLPEVRTLTKHATDWRPFHTLNALSDEAQSQSRDRIYLSALRRKTLSSGAKMAILDGLSSAGVPVSSDLFASLINETNPLVKQSTVRHHFATDEKLEPGERVKRVRSMLNASPYQVRLETLRELEQFSDVRFRKSVDTSTFETCKTESNPKVQELCHSTQKRYETLKARSSGQ